MSVFIVNQDK